MVILHWVILLLMFYLIAVICDYFFVPALENIAKKWKMSSEFAWATLMAVGSSAPELFTSLFAVLNPAIVPSLGAGTIVGSAIFNILVIIGASAMVRSATITWQPVIRDLAFYAISILLLLRVFQDGTIVAWEMIVFLVLYLVYVRVAKNRRTWLGYDEPEWEEDTEDHDGEERGVNGLVTKLFSYIIPHHDKYAGWSFLVSIILIWVTTHIMVESAVHLAEYFRIHPAIVWLTILAMWTSVPDLLSSLVVAKKGKWDMAITNAIGSNIFDILFWLSVPYLIYFMINDGVNTLAVDANNLKASIVLLFATVIAVFFLLIVKKWHMTRPAGIFLVLLYVGYVIYNIFQVVS